MKVLHRSLAGLLVIFGIVVPTLLGLRTPGYDPLAQYLSELGATGAPHAVWMNVGGFGPTGALFAGGALVLWRAAGRGALASLGCLLLLGTAVSYIGAAFNPCDAGCPSTGSVSQTLHNFLGLFGYLFTPPGQALVAARLFVVGRRGLATQTLGASACGVFGFVGMVVQQGGPWMGLWQRLADFSTVGWMAFVLVVLSGAPVEDAPSTVARSGG